MSVRMNFRKHILTKELCENLGHVAWVEDTSPVSAIQRMLTSVSAESINCAVWSNSYLNLDAGVVTAIAEWRSKFSYNFSGDPLRGVESNKTPLAIAKYFEHVVGKSNAKLKIDASARGDFTKGVRALEIFVLDRTEQIREATQSSTISVRPKASAKHDNVFETPNLHVDYESMHVKFRFLDAINCPHTVLPRNRDIMPFGSEGYYQFKAASAQDPIDIFEFPPNSMIILSQSQKNPIVHTQPFIYEEGQKTVSRTTVTYDIA